MRNLIKKLLLNGWREIKFAASVVVPAALGQ